MAAIEKADKSQTPEGAAGKVRARTQPMQVLCVGLGRTGTTTMTAALDVLGIGPTYDMNELGRRPQDYNFWMERFGPTWPILHQTYTNPEDWDDVLFDCAAVADSPCLLGTRQLIEAYPETKVILTVRHSYQEWCRSFINSIYIHRSKSQHIVGIILFKLDVFFFPSFNIQRPQEHISHQFWKLFPSLPRFPEWGPTIYERYNADIIKHCPPERLLVYHVEEGWDPLCKFLGQEIPETPFPTSNESGLYQKKHEELYQIRKRRVLKALGIRVGIVGAIGLVVAGVRYLPEEWTPWRR